MEEMGSGLGSSSGVLGTRKEGWFGRRGVSSEKKPRLDGLVRKELAGALMLENEGGVKAVSY